MTKQKKRVGGSELYTDVPAMTLEQYRKQEEAPAVHFVRYEQRDTSE